MVTSGTDWVSSWIWVHDVFAISALWRAVPALAFVFYCQHLFRTRTTKLRFIPLICATISTLAGSSFVSIASWDSAAVPIILLDLGINWIIIHILTLWALQYDLDLFKHTPASVKKLITACLALASAVTLGQAIGGCVWYLPVLWWAEQDVYTWGRFGRDIVDTNTLMIIYAAIAALLAKFTWDWRRLNQLHD